MRLFSKFKTTTNKNRAFLEPQAISDEFLISGFFCSLLFLDIKKPQSLDFSKDCGAYFYYLTLYHNEFVRILFTR